MNMNEKTGAVIWWVLGLPLRLVWGVGMTGWCFVLIFVMSITGWKAIGQLWWWVDNAKTEDIKYFKRLLREERMRLNRE